MNNLACERSVGTRIITVIVILAGGLRADGLGYYVKWRAGEPKRESIRGGVSIFGMAFPAVCRPLRLAPEFLWNVTLSVAQRTQTQGIWA